jgi:ribosomal 50S subunit-recycling heat shock protein
MRLDKFLKVSRLLKRRTAAHDACEKGRIFVNGKGAKPSHALKIGDEVCIGFGENKLTVKILSLSEHAKKEEAALMYQTVEKADDGATPRNGY